MGGAFELCKIQIPTYSPTLPGWGVVGHNIDRCITTNGCPLLWKVISVKSLLYVINVVIKKNAVLIKNSAVFCKRSLKYPA